MLSLSKENMWEDYWWTACKYQASILQSPLANIELWKCYDILDNFSFLFWLEDITSGGWVPRGPPWTIIYLLSVSHQFPFILITSLEPETWNLLVWYFGCFLAQLHFVQCVPKYSLKSKIVEKFLYKFQYPS